MQYIVVHNVVVLPEARDMRNPKRIRFTGELLDEGDVDAARLMRWRDAGYIVPAGDAGLHLIIMCEFLPPEVKQVLFTVGVFTLEKFAGNQADFLGEPITVEAWLAQNGIDAKDTARWMALARAELAPKIAAKE